MLFDKSHGVTGLGGREVVLSEEIPGAESSTRVTSYNSPHPRDRQTYDKNKHPGTIEKQLSFDISKNPQNDIFLRLKFKVPFF